MRQHDDPGISGRIGSALNELRMLIAASFPTASFSVVHGDDPEGFYLRVVVDVEYPDDVMDVVVDRLYAFEVEDGLPVYVLPVEPLRGVGTDSRGSSAAVRPAALLDLPG